MKKLVVGLAVLCCTVGNASAQDTSDMWKAIAGATNSYTQLTDTPSPPATPSPEPTYYTSTPPSAVPSGPSDIDAIAAACMQMTGGTMAAYTKCVSMYTAGLLACSTIADTISREACIGAVMLAGGFTLPPSPDVF